MSWFETLVSKPSSGPDFTQKENVVGEEKRNFDMW